MPNRILKESICSSEEIDALSWFEEVLFYRLLVKCDDYGRFDGRAAIIKGSCFPLKDVTNKDIEKALYKLSAAGLVRVYEAQGRPYLQLVTWEQHQQIRTKRSKYPDPDIICNQMISNDIKCSRNPIQSNTNTNPNPNARASRVQECIERFIASYPLPSNQINRYMVETEFIRCVSGAEGLAEQLEDAAKNYADSLKRLGKDKEADYRYVIKPENFVKNREFIKYLRENYVPPKVKGNAYKQWQPTEQRDYDFERLEKELLSN